MNKTELKRYFLVDLLRNKIDLNCFLFSLSLSRSIYRFILFVCALFLYYSLFCCCKKKFVGECVCMCLSRWITFITSSFVYFLLEFEKIFRFGFLYYFFSIQFRQVLKERRKQEKFD